MNGLEIEPFADRNEYFSHMEKPFVACDDIFCRAFFSQMVNKF